MTFVNHDTVQHGVICYVLVVMAHGDKLTEKYTEFINQRCQLERTNGATKPRSMSL
jgi:hypothetical protein